MASGKLNIPPLRVLTKVLERFAPFLLPAFLPREGAESFFLPASKHYFHDSVIGLALRRGDRPCIYVERDPRVRMTQKFLRRFEVYSRRPQVCGKRVAEAMPGVATLDRCLIRPFSTLLLQSQW